MSRRGYQQGGRRPEPEFPKPFDFVPLPRKPDKGRPPGHEQFHLDGHLSGRFEYRLVIKSPVHVSSGNYALSEDIGFPPGGVIRDCYRVAADDERPPAIPGSSLKGATRAVAEAVSASCVVATRERRELPRDLWSCRPPNLCPACALFGAMSRLGRVSFGDAILVEGGTHLERVPALYRPRPRQSPRTYKEGQRLKGRKFYFHGRLSQHSGGHQVEALTPGSVLAGTVDLTGVAPAELGLLFFAMGLDGSFRPMLGGGKPVCLGAVEFLPQSLALVTEDSLLAYDADEKVLTGDDLKTFVAARINDADQAGLIRRKQADKLREILDPDNPRPAPTGVY